MIKILPITKEGVLKLQKLGKQSFLETYQEDNTASDMAQYLEDNFSVDQLLKELTNPYSLFYYAEVGGEWIGYLKVNFGQAQTEDYLEGALEIERIYVLSEYHGKKVANALFNQALVIAQERDMEFIWLGVWEENPRAIRFYEKQGFVKFDEHIFKLGEDDQTDIIMKLNLK